MLQDLVWVEDRTYDILGTRIKVRSVEQRLPRLMDGLLSSFSLSDRPARPSNTFSISTAKGGFRLYRNCSATLQANADELGKVANQLLMMINRQVVAGLNDFAVHAGVFAGPDETIAVVGPSGIGKTTLTASAIMHGFSYGSDEALILDPARLVIPYPKPLGLGPWTREALDLTTTAPFSTTGEVPTPAANLGAKTVEGPQALTTLLVPSITHSHPRLSALPPSQAVKELVHNSFNHYKNPERAFHIVTETANSVKVLKFEYGDPVEAGRYLSANLG